MMTEDMTDSKAARCLFDESQIWSMFDLEKLTERGRQTKIKLNIDPAPYGRCCRDRFQLVSHSVSLTALHRIHRSLQQHIYAYVSRGVSSSSSLGWLLARSVFGVPRIPDDIIHD